MEPKFSSSVAFLLFRRNSHLAAIGRNFAKLGNGRF